MGVFGSTWICSWKLSELRLFITKVIAVSREETTHVIFMHVKESEIKFNAELFIMRYVIRTLMMANETNDI